MLDIKSTKIKKLEKVLDKILARLKFDSYQ